MREFFLCLSIASFDDKQHLSEVVFSALVGFLLLEKYPTFGRVEKTGIPGVLET